MVGISLRKKKRRKELVSPETHQKGNEKYHKIVTFFQGLVLRGGDIEE